MRPFLALYVGGMGSRAAELLQPARRHVRVRGRRADGAGPLPRRAQGGGRRGAAGRADRRRLAVRSARRRARAPAGLRAGGGRHADRLARRRDVRGAPRAAADWWPSSPDEACRPTWRCARPGAVDVAGIAELVGACDATYRSWAPPGWEPPPAGRELDRWRGRVTDGSWWTRIAVEPAGRVVGLVCFTQAVTGAPPWVEPIPGRAHVSAMFTPSRPLARGRSRAACWARPSARCARPATWRRSCGRRSRRPARGFYEAQGWRARRPPPVARRPVAADRGLRQVAVTPPGAAARPLRILLGAFGDPGHAFPMLALGERLVARGHAVALQTWRRWQAPAEAAGMTFLAAPEYQVWPTRERPLAPYAAAVRAAHETVPAVGGLRARRRRRRHPHGRAGARGGGLRRAGGDARAARPSVAAAGLPAVLHRRPSSAHARGRRWPGGRSTRRCAAGSTSAARSTTRRAGGSASGPLPYLHTGLSRSLTLVATLPQLEYPRRWPAWLRVVGPLLWEPPGGEAVAPPAGSGPVVLLAPSTSQDPGAGRCSAQRSPGSRARRCV